MAPAAMLEGDFAGSSSCPPIITTCPKLDRQIHALHALARSGVIPLDTADRQLNSYLLAAARRVPGIPPRLLVMPIADAPHHTVLPDLGNVIHGILAHSPMPGSLSAVLEQCLPAWRHSTRPITYQDSQDVLLNVALALLLGLYPGGTVKRPRFEARADLFARIHLLLTETQEAKTTFCQKHPDIILMACMEYTARMLPINIPSQHAFIQERDPSTAMYFRRIPALGDELRETLDSIQPPDWCQIQSLAASMVERVTRLKKSGPAQPMQEHVSTEYLHHLSREALVSHWDAPRLHGIPNTEEFRVLGLGMQLQGRLLSHIQREVQVHTRHLPHPCWSPCRSFYLPASLAIPSTCLPC